MRSFSLQIFLFENPPDSDDDNKDPSIRNMDSHNDSNNNANFKNYSGSKKSRYFWQYNVQAKGPKGQRLVIKTQLEDPHVLNEVTDPVFSPNCSVRGIKVGLKVNCIQISYFCLET